MIHVWGMTELSPIGTLGKLKGKHVNLDAVQRRALQEKQGRSLYGIDMKIVDEHGDELPRDGRTWAS